MGELKSPFQDNSLTMRQTSLNAYEEIKSRGLLSALQFEVYQTLYFNGPMTQGELWKYHFPYSQRHDIGPRCAELQEMGVIAVAGKRPCRVTGHTCLTWDTTDNLPSAPTPKPKQPNVREALAALQAEVAELKQAMARLQRGPTQGDFFESMKGH